MFDNRRDIRLPKDSTPQLIVVVDAEEEFDWQAEPDATANLVTSMAHIGRVQGIFDEYGIRPCYVIDYPVASQPEGYEPLLEIFRQGRCEIGAQLHPWVNPPQDEVLTRSNMYPGNLPESLERQKLICLRDAISKQFGSRPIAYKAGRYGFGDNTARILSELGFTIDLSVCPPMDASDEGGPDYSHSRPAHSGLATVPTESLKSPARVDLSAGLAGFHGPFSTAPGRSDGSGYWGYLPDCGRWTG